MKIALLVSVAEDYTRPIVEMVFDLSAYLNKYFENKNYGNDVLTIQIGFIIVRKKEGYENWYLPKKTKYVDAKTEKSKLTNEIKEVNKHFSYEIKIDDAVIEEMIKSSISERKKLLCSEVLKSLDTLNELPKKVKDFDKGKFKADIEQFFKEEKLI